MNIDIFQLVPLIIGVFGSLIGGGITWGIAWGATKTRIDENEKNFEETKQSMKDEIEELKIQMKEDRNKNETRIKNVENITTNFQLNVEKQLVRIETILNIIAMKVDISASSNKTS